MKSLRNSWRAVAVIASWVLWPIAYFSAYWLVSVVLASGRRCSIEGCDPPAGAAGVLWLVGLIAVPAFVTYRWLRVRRSTR